MLKCLRHYSLTTAALLSMKISPFGREAAVATYLGATPAKSHLKLFHGQPLRPCARDRRPQGGFSDVMEPKPILSGLRWRRLFS